MNPIKITNQVWLGYYHFFIVQNLIHMSKTQRKKQNKKTRKTKQKNKKIKKMKKINRKIEKYYHHDGEQ